MIEFQNIEKTLVFTIVFEIHSHLLIALPNWPKIICLQKIGCTSEVSHQTPFFATTYFCKYVINQVTRPIFFLHHICQSQKWTV